MIKNNATHYEERSDSTPIDTPIPPNRQKFASLVRKLDPAYEGYAAQVSSLQRDYERRADLIERLSGYDTSDNTYVAFDGNMELLRRFNSAMRVAIERFVVDNF